MCGKLAGDTLRFQGGEETLCHCIIVTVANSAHAQLDVRTCQAILVSSTGVLTALDALLNVKLQFVRY